MDLSWMAWTQPTAVFFLTDRLAASHYVDLGIF